MSYARVFLSAQKALSGVDRAVDRLTALFREVALPARRVLYQQRDTPPGFHWLCSGWVKVFRTSPSGRDLIMGVCGPGDAFGPCCCPLDVAESPCEARTQTQVRLLVLTAQAWRALSTTEPDLARALSQVLLASRRACTDLAATLAFQPVRDRLLALLVSLATKVSGTHAGEVALPQVLSQTEMASAVGTAREVVTRLLARFEQEGVLRRRGRQIVLRASVMASRGA